MKKYPVFLKKIDLLFKFQFFVKKKLNTNFFLLLFQFNGHFFTCYSNLFHSSLACMQVACITLQQKDTNSKLYSYDCKPWFADLSVDIEKVRVENTVRGHPEMTSARGQREGSEKADALISMGGA